MPHTMIPSPARSQNAISTPRRYRSRVSRSVGSPARSVASEKLTSVMQFKENKVDTFILSPMTRKSVLSDNTDIEQPGRKSWWRRLDETREVMEVLDSNKIMGEVNNVVEDYIDIEVLSQEMKNTTELPESSDNESIKSIVIPQKRLFMHKEIRLSKKFGQIISTRESIQKSNFRSQDKTVDVSDKSIDIEPKSLFNNKGSKRTKPVFPSALLITSPDKTLNKTTELPAEAKIKSRNLFGNKPANKRKNMFANFILSESEDELPEIQPRIFAFKNKPTVQCRRSSQRNPSLTSSVANDTYVDDWKLIPSSTMIENQFEDLASANASKRTRLSKLSEIKEFQSAANISVNKTKQSITFVPSKDISKISPNEKEANASNIPKNKSNSLVKSNSVSCLYKESLHKQETEILIDNHTQNNEKKSQSELINTSQENHDNVKLVNSPEIEKGNSDQQFNVTNDGKFIKGKENIETMEEISNNENRSYENITEEQVTEEDIYDMNRENLSDHEVVQENKQTEEEQEDIGNQELSIEDQNYQEHCEENYKDMEDQDDHDKADEEDKEAEEEDIGNGENSVEIQGDIDNQEHSKENIEENSKNEDSEQLQEDTENAESSDEENNSEEMISTSANKEFEHEDEPMDTTNNQDESVLDNEDSVNDQESNQSPEEEQDYKVAEEEIEDHTDQYTSEKQNENLEEKQTSLAEQVLQRKSTTKDEISKSTDNTLSNAKKEEEKDNQESFEAILHNSISINELSELKGRNTSIRKTKSIINKFELKPSLAPVRQSTAISDGTTNSSAERSGWDSHRTTRKTLRQTFGRDFTPRKSLRTLVMEKAAKLQTIPNVNTDVQQENSAELHEISAQRDVEMSENEDMTSSNQNHQENSGSQDVTDIHVNDSSDHVEESEHEDNLESIAPNDTTPLQTDETIQESEHEMSIRTRQTTLEMYLQKIREKNMERRLRTQQVCQKMLRPPLKDTLNIYTAPSRLVTLPSAKTIQNRAKSKIVKSSVIPISALPQEFLEDIKYKPPKRFQPRNASWATKHLYKFLETKLEPKYDYKARVRAEKLVEVIYNFTKIVRRNDLAPKEIVEELKQEMARLNIIKTHYDFYDFFHKFMPREIRVKVNPDAINKISLPTRGVFSDIIQGNNVEQ